MLSNSSKTTIVVTDADNVAVRAIEHVAKRAGAEVVSETAGNPTRVQVEEVIEAIEHAESETVIVMADDAGDAHRGPGEKLIEKLHEEYHVDAAVAVASNSHAADGVPVDESVTQDGKVVRQAVDKKGKPVKSRVVVGDTVDVLNEIEVPVVGIGDIGKAPRGRKGEEVLEKAIEEAQRLAESATPKSAEKPRSGKDQASPVVPEAHGQDREHVSDREEPRSFGPGSDDEQTEATHGEDGEADEVKGEHDDGERNAKSGKRHHRQGSKKRRSNRQKRAA